MMAIDEHATSSGILRAPKAAGTDTHLDNEKYQFLPSGPRLSKV